MNLRRCAVLAFFVSAAVHAADQSTQPLPVTGNPVDSPARVKSGQVFASTDVDLPPALGPQPAKVTVIVFSDFQCPVCRRSADATQQIAEEFPGEVRVEFWQNALAMHANAENAAVASLAAHRQGKFWEYHDEVFRNQGHLDYASLARYAEQLGLDLERFKSDYAAPELRLRVKAESAFANQFSAKSTPAFMVNGKVHIGWGSWLGFKADVERELARARKLEAPGTTIEQIADQRAQAQIEDPDLLGSYRELVLRAAPDSSKKKQKKAKKA